MKKFAKLPSLEKKKLLVGRLGTKVHELFPKEETTEEDMASDKKRSVMNPGKHEFLDI